MPPKTPRIALVHEHLAQDGGAERVVQAIMETYPKAPLYTLLYNPERAHPWFKGKNIRTSFLQQMPGGIRFYQWYVSWMPNAIERFDFRDYDIVISSASAFAKGIITDTRTLHLCYLHSPTRYLWNDTHSYVHDLPYPRWMRSLIPFSLTHLRQWDRLAADRPDVLIANSRTVQRRIQKYYRRTSQVIHPPVDIKRFTQASGSGQYYLTGGRLVPYKRFDIAVRAFSKMGLPLKIYGDGPALAELQSMAKPNIEFLGRVPDDQLNQLYGQAIAFLYPQEEDFGITAVEAMATGRPIIAYGAGGATETVKPGETGVWFKDQEWESLADAVIRFRPEAYDPKVIRAWAETFSLATFQKALTNQVDRAWQEHQAQVGY